ncbi:MAG: insulinase family protein [Phycisphaerales bacterium]|nr:insulinase family protein [Phycisphaerales bacterium]
MNAMTHRSVLLLAAAVLAGTTGAVATADVPARPEQIHFAPLSFEPPSAAEYRHVLPSGVVVYLAPSTEFPLVNIAMTFKGGRDLDPADQVGLADATGAMIRRGGTKNMSAEDLDETFDFLAANVSTNCGPVTSSAVLNSLKSNLDESLPLFFEMLRTPGFDAAKLGLWQSEQLERMKQRNDDAGPILSREWDALLYGRDHFEAAQSTQKSIESIDQASLQRMHDRIFHPGNVIVAVTGDFDEKDMLDRLEQAFAGWERGDQVSDPAAPTATFTPGVYHVEKDIPQGKVNIGLRGITRDDPDYYAMTILNDILGGGGFTSRITKRVRSDEGLAYSAGSANSAGVYYPGEFRASFQSKNRTVALATKIIMEEIERIRTEPVSDEELATSVNSMIETFPRTFESKAGMLNVFVSDEWTNRPADYWQKYRDRLRAVTKDDILRVAQKHLDPNAMAIFVVGKWSEIAPGDLEGRASMAEFFGGSVTDLPLRDPMTMEPIPTGGG